MTCHQLPTFVHLSKSFLTADDKDAREVLQRCGTHDWWLCRGCRGGFLSGSSSGKGGSGSFCRWWHEW